MTSRPRLVQALHGAVAKRHDALDDVAGNYAAVLHYLKAMEALGGNPHDAAKVFAKMKEFRPTIRCSEGTAPDRWPQDHSGLSVRVKKARGVEIIPGTINKTIATISPEDAAKPLEASECPLVRNNERTGRPDLTSAGRGGQHAETGAGV